VKKDARLCRIIALQVVLYKGSLPACIDCRSGACDYYEVRRDGRQRQITLDEVFVNILAELYIIPILVSTGS